MTVDEALAAIGLTDLDGVTPDQLRRSYLRALRAHPPERDPHGFTRVRESYELLRAGLAWHALMDAPAVEEPALAVPAGSPPPRLHLADVLAEIAGCLEASDLDQARVWLDRWSRDQGGDDCRRTSPDEAARWKLARELVEVAEELPAPVRIALARAVVAGDFAEARGALARFGQNARLHAAAAEAALARRAPALHVFVDGCLTSPPPRIVGRYGAKGAPSHWWIVLVVLTVGRLVFQLGQADRSARRPVPTPLEIATGADPANFARAVERSDIVAAPAPPPARASELLAELDARARWLSKHGSPSQRALARAIRTSARRRECASLREAAKGLVRTADKGELAADVRDAIGATAGHAFTLCPDDRTQLP